MKARELLLECKIALNVSSDYALAAALKIPRARISDYMKGERIPDEYACFRIAEALRRDPAEIIAEIRAESDEKHADYFRDFLSRRGIRELVVGALLLTSSGSYTPEAAAADFAVAHNGRLRRTRKTPLTLKTASGRFFYAHRGESGHHALAPDDGATPAGHGAAWCRERHTKPRHPLGLAARVCADLCTVSGDKSVDNEVPALRRKACSAVVKKLAFS